MEKDTFELPPFGTYRFGVNTRIKWKGFTFEVVSVDFESEHVGVIDPFSNDIEMIKYSELQEVWESM